MGPEHHDRADEEEHGLDRGHREGDDARSGEQRAERGGAAEEHLERAGSLFIRDAPAEGRQPHADEGHHHQADHREFEVVTSEAVQVTWVVDELRHEVQGRRHEQDLEELQEELEVIGDLNREIAASNGQYRPGDRTS